MLIFSGETECQGSEDNDEFGDEAEQDELLIECAGEVFASLGKIIPSDEFVAHFETLLPVMVNRLVRLK